MALKKKLTAAEFADLSDDLKAEYKKAGKGYVLDLEDDGGDGDDAAELRRANERLKQEKKDAQKLARETQAKLDELDGNDARKSGDIDKIEKGWQTKLDTATAEGEAKLAKMRDAFLKTLDVQALDIATAISNSPKLLAKHIRERLSVNFEGDEPEVVILDAKGKPSKLSVDDLKKEVSADKDFASIIIASKASGGGAPRTGEIPVRPAVPGNAAATGSDKPPLLSSLNPRDLAAAIKAKRDEKAAAQP